jgi:hypothetical protein
MRGSIATWLMAVSSSPEMTFSQLNGASAATDANIAATIWMVGVQPWPR